MKFFIAVASLASLVPQILALTVNTPSNVVVCQPILLSWADGSAPYFLSIIPGGQPSAAAIKTFPTQNGNSLTWNVDLPAGTSITVSLKDSTGAQAYSDVVQIQSGGDSACVNTSVQASGTGGPAPTAGNTAPAATTTGGAPAPPATGPATRSGSSSGTQTEASSATRAGTASAAPAPSKSGNAAFKSSVGTYGLAGAMGLLGLAVL